MKKYTDVLKIVLQFSIPVNGISLLL